MAICPNCITDVGEPPPSRCPNCRSPLDPVSTGSVPAERVAAVRTSDAPPGRLPPLPQSRPARPWWRRLVGPAIVLLFIFGPRLLDSIQEPDRSDSGVIASEGTLLFEDLRIGDCLMDPLNGSQGEADEVDAVPCSQSHDLEVMATVRLREASTYPGEQEAFFEAADLCLLMFDGYVGRDYESSALDVTIYSPTEQSWKAGDREAVCLVGRVDLAKVTGMLENSGL